MADDDKVVSALAKMVDDRLAAEFEKRDKMILNLKSGMDKLVQTLREGNNKKIKNGPTLKIQPRPPSSRQSNLGGGDGDDLSMSQLALTTTPNVSKKGGSALKWGSRSNVPPKRKKKQLAAMMYGTKRRHPVRKGHRAYKALPPVTKGKPSRDAYGRLEYHTNTPRVASIMEVGHNTKEAVSLCVCVCFLFFCFFVLYH